MKNNYLLSPPAKAGGNSRGNSKFNSTNNLNRNVALAHSKEAIQQII